MSRNHGLLQRLIFKSLHLYRLKGPPGWKNACRYSPTCSHYMQLAIEKEGVLRGIVKGLKRIVRCRPPFGGHDLP